MVEKVEKRNVEMHGRASDFSWDVHLSKKNRMG